MPHTAGPWSREWEQDGEYTGLGDNPPGYAGDWLPTNAIIAAIDGEIVSVAYAENGADAQLISAAPDLLAACEELLPWMEGYYTDQGDRLDQSINRLRAAISKAKGGMP